VLLRGKICAKNVEEIYQKQWKKSTSGFGKEIRESRIKPGEFFLPLGKQFSLFQI
jgi:hypothetical protein